MEEGTRGSSIVPGNSDTAVNYPVEPIVSYAQTHEDVLLWRALCGVGTGFYIDVGAHDPVALSVTKAFYDRGWHGINIEPIPSRAEKFIRERPRDKTIQAAIGSKPGKATLHDFGSTGLSTLVDDFVTSHSKDGVEQKEEYSVPVTTLSEVFNQIVAGQQVHFLKIDVEGFEREVILGADFTRVRPWIILLEAVRPMTAEPTHIEWERELLNWGYIYAFFDGLNRYYVSEEHEELLKFFAAPVNVLDKYRDSAPDEQKTQQQIATLSDNNRVLRNKLRAVMRAHESPRLFPEPGTPVAALDDDAEGLLRIVGAQATSLVHLRRSLVAAARLSHDRLDQISNLAALAQTSRADRVTSEVQLREQLVLNEQLREQLVLNEHVLRDQADVLQQKIGELLEHSRWRKLGLQLGLAKRTAWETQDWRPQNVGEMASDEIVATVLQLSARLDELKRSRWRRLGQLAGIVKPAKWENEPSNELFIGLIESRSAAPLSSVVDAAPPTVITLPNSTQVAPSATSSEAIPVGASEETEAVRRFFNECRARAIDLVLDVGANTGQFGLSLRQEGYSGQIVSFEPLSSAHQQLAAITADDPLWEVAERCALGSENGTAEINIAANSYSSSILPMLDLHREAAPDSGYNAVEKCKVVTLDTFFDEVNSDPSISVALKIDTQGFEVKVLSGLDRHLPKVAIVLCEMSLAPLYDGGPGIADVCSKLAQLNFRCAAIFPGFAHRSTGALLQVDGIFVSNRD